jgi:hypothetical protein
MIRWGYTDRGKDLSPTILRSSFRTGGPELRIAVPGYVENRRKVEL